MNASTLNDLPEGSVVPIGGFLLTKVSNGWMLGDIDRCVNKILSAEEAEGLPYWSRVYIDPPILMKQHLKWYNPDGTPVWGTGRLSTNFKYRVKDYNYER